MAGNKADKKISPNKVLPPLPALDDGLRALVVENRRQELQDFINYLSAHNLLVITGLAGIGKTTIAQLLVEIRHQDVPMPFWYDFEKIELATLVDIMDRLAIYFDEPRLSPSSSEAKVVTDDMLYLLVEILNNDTSYWIVFDNVEKIMDDDLKFITPLSGGAGLARLFEILATSKHKGKILLTSRSIPRLDNNKELVFGLGQEYKQVTGLSVESSVMMLQRYGLNDIGNQVLIDLVKGVDGHPLALTLLIELVKKEGSPNGILADLKRWKHENKETLIITRGLFDKLVESEKELLSYLSVFDEPLPRTAFLQMIDHNKRKECHLEALCNKSLINVKKGRYSLHPLVKEFAYDDLKDKSSAHQLAAKFYLSQSTIKDASSISDAEPLLSAFNHLVEAGNADSAYNLIFDNNLHEKLNLWGNAAILVNIYNKSLSLKLSKEQLGTIKGNLGLAWCALSDSQKAIKNYKQALEITREIGDRRAEESGLGNLGNAYLALSDSQKAINYYKQALEIAREIGDRRGEGIALGNLGLAWAILGKIKKAIDYYKQDLEITREIGNCRGEGIVLGRLGKAWFYLGEIEKAINYYKQALEISREIKNRFVEGNRLGDLGNAYVFLGEVEQAINYHEKAFEIAREIGDRCGEGVHLSDLGLAWAAQGKIKKAIEFLNKAKNIFIDTKSPNVAIVEERIKKLKKL